MKNTYEIRENKFGKFFIKNNKYYYLDSFDVWGLDTSLWYDTIDYIFYKVRFIEENNKKYYLVITPSHNYFNEIGE